MDTFAHVPSHAPSGPGSRHHGPERDRPFVLTVAILASALGFIDGSVVAIAIPQIRASLDATFAEIQWVANAYVLCLAAFMLLGGAAGDRYGVKRTFGAGIALFIVASMACAFAWSPVSLIVARAVQGLGAAIMVPCSLALIAKNYPREDRGRAIGLWAAASSLTTALGPVLGGWLLTTGGGEAWRWVFAINLPLGGLALWLLWRRVPEDAGRSTEPLDALGAVLATLALGALAFGLTLLGEGAGETVSVWPWLLLAASVALGLVWIVHLRRSTHPMIDLTLFGSSGFSGANVSTFLLYTALGGVLFFLPMTIVTAWGLSELEAGSIFLPFSLLIAGLSPWAGRWADRAGSRLPLTVGPAIVGVGFAMAALSVPGHAFWSGLLPALLVVGIGMGITVSPLSTAVMLAVDDDHSGEASGVNNMVARMANLFAIAGLGAIAALIHDAHVASSSLPGRFRDALVEAGYGERLTGALYLPEVAAVQGTAMDSAFAWLCWLTAALAFLAALVGWRTQGARS